MKKLFDFYADWCGPCKGMSPIIEDIEKTYPEQVKKIDVDQNPKLAQKHAIMSIPTYLILDGDKEVARFIGATSQADLVKHL